MSPTSLHLCLDINLTLIIDLISPFSSARYWPVPTRFGSNSCELWTTGGRPCGEPLYCRRDGNVVVQREQNRRTTWVPSNRPGRSHKVLGNCTGLFDGKHTSCLQSSTFEVCHYPAWWWVNAFLCISGEFNDCNRKSCQSFTMYECVIVVTLKRQYHNKPNIDESRSIPILTGIEGVPFSIIINYA